LSDLREVVLQDAKASGVGGHRIGGCDHDSG
jgi:hypothetical protein